MTVLEKAWTIPFYAIGWLAGAVARLAKLAWGALQVGFEDAVWIKVTTR